MGKVGILTEKLSAARNFAGSLGGMSGTFGGTGYVIVNAGEHLLNLTACNRKDLKGVAA
ncbi:hypothetical protein [Rhodococcus globerulus]|uniref:hypothetical protein n=1 Tax=Rhodococcus globerulus TaxID=33008 RepID=UPI000A98B2B9|nr:hypothetical protein [Rhodococcus globerulus]